MVRALKATVDFRHPATRTEAVAMAEAVVTEVPDRGPHGADRRPPQRRRTGAGADHHRRGAGAGAEDQGLHPVRLAALEATGDMAGAGAELAHMAELFPDDPGVRRGLISGTCARATPTPPRRCCAPRRRAPTTRSRR